MRVVVSDGLSSSSPSSPSSLENRPIANGFDVDDKPETENDNGTTARDAAINLQEERFMEQKHSADDYRKTITELNEYFQTDPRGQEVSDFYNNNFEDYLNSIQDLISAGWLAEQIIDRSYTGLYEEQNPARAEIIDREATRGILGDLSPEEQENALDAAEEYLSSTRNSRPITESIPQTEVNVDNSGENYGAVRYSDDDPRGNFDIYQKLKDLYEASPRLAEALTNEGTKSLYIKRANIPSIYPPKPKNTNLEVVQQAIANYQYDSNLLNVYFN